MDRTSIDLPGDQDELVRRVAAVSPATVVVVNAGSPISMPWLDEVESVLMAWFPGQAMGESLVDVLLGDVEPQGQPARSRSRRRFEDTPAFGAPPGPQRQGAVPRRPPRWGIAGTTRSVASRRCSRSGSVSAYASTTHRSADVTAPDPFTVRGDRLSNDSDRDGVEVVQVYAHLVDRRGSRLRTSPTNVSSASPRCDVAAGARADVSSRAARPRYAYRTMGHSRRHGWTTRTGVRRTAGRSVVARHRGTTDRHGGQAMSAGGTTFRRDCSRRRQHRRLRSRFGRDALGVLGAAVGDEGAYRFAERARAAAPRTHRALLARLYPDHDIAALECRILEVLIGRGEHPQAESCVDLDARARGAIRSWFQDADHDGATSPTPSSSAARCRGVADHLDLPRRPARHVSAPDERVEGARGCQRRRLCDRRLHRCRSRTSARERDLEVARRRAPRAW